MEKQDKEQPAELTKRKERQRWLKIRSNPIDLYFIKERAKNANLTVSDYVRYCTLGPTATKVMPHAETVAEIRAELEMLRRTSAQAVQLAQQAAKDGTITLNHMKSLGQIFQHCGYNVDRLEKVMVEAITQSKS